MRAESGRGVAALAAALAANRRYHSRGMLLLLGFLVTIDNVSDGVVAATLLTKTTWPQHQYKVLCISSYIHRDSVVPVSLWAPCRCRFLIWLLEVGKRELAAAITSWFSASEPLPPGGNRSRNDRIAKNLRQAGSKWSLLYKAWKLSQGPIFCSEYWQR